MTIISDTSPLRYLALIGRMDLLPKLFGSVTCPQSVSDECRHPHAPQVLRTLLLSPHDWLVIEPDPPIPPDLASALDAGEASAIALAETKANALLLIDERKGRRLAESRGLVRGGHGERSRRSRTVWVHQLS